jgi:hypothetical protein
MTSLIMNECPICRFRGNEPGWYAGDFEICACCATEFGVDDFLKSRGQLQREWRQEGARWRGPIALRPASWSSHRQLKRIRDLLPEIRCSSEAGATVVLAPMQFVTDEHLPQAQFFSATSPDRIRYAVLVGQ